MKNLNKTKQTKWDKQKWVEQWLWVFDLHGCLQSCLYSLTKNSVVHIANDPVKCFSTIHKEQKLAIQLNKFHLTIVQICHGFACTWHIVWHSSKSWWLHGKILLQISAQDSVSLSNQNCSTICMNYIKNNKMSWICKSNIWMQQILKHVQKILWMQTVTRKCSVIELWFLQLRIIGWQMSVAFALIATLLSHNGNVNCAPLQCACHFSKWMMPLAQVHWNCFVGCFPLRHCLLVNSNLILPTVFQKMESVLEHYYCPSHLKTIWHANYIEVNPMPVQQFVMGIYVSQLSNLFGISAKLALQSYVWKNYIPRMTWKMKSALLQKPTVKQDINTNHHQKHRRLFQDITTNTTTASTGLNNYQQKQGRSNASNHSFIWVASINVMSNFIMHGFQLFHYSLVHFLD